MTGSGGEPLHELEPLGVDQQEPDVGGRYAQVAAQQRAEDAAPGDVGGAVAREDVPRGLLALVGREGLVEGGDAVVRQ